MNYTWLASHLPRCGLCNVSHAPRIVCVRAHTHQRGCIYIQTWNEGTVTHSLCSLFLPLSAPPPPHHPPHSTIHPLISAFYATEVEELKRLISTIFFFCFFFSLAQNIVPKINKRASCRITHSDTKRQCKIRRDCGDLFVSFLVGTFCCAPFRN